MNVQRSRGKRAEENVMVNVTVVNITQEQCPVPRLSFRTTQSLCRPLWGSGPTEFYCTRLTRQCAISSSWDSQEKDRLPGRECCPRMPQSRWCATILSGLCIIQLGLLLFCSLLLDSKRTLSLSTVVDQWIDSGKAADQESDGHHFEFMAVASTSPAGCVFLFVGNEPFRQASSIVLLCCSYIFALNCNCKQANWWVFSHTNLFCQIIGHFPDKLPFRICKELLATDPQRDPSEANCYWGNTCMIRRRTFNRLSWTSSSGYAPGWNSM